MVSQGLVWAASFLIVLATLAGVALVFRPGSSETVEVGRVVSDPSSGTGRSPKRFLVLTLLAVVASWAAWGQHGTFRLPNLSLPTIAQGHGPNGTSPFDVFRRREPAAQGDKDDKSTEVGVPEVTAPASRAVVDGAVVNEAPVTGPSTNQDQASDKPVSDATAAGTPTTNPVARP